MVDTYSVSWATGARMFEERFSEFVTLFIVINPLGTLPMFLALTAGLDAATQRRIAATAVLVSFAVLLFFVVAGGLLLQQLGISLRAFQIAGGIVLFLVALDMVRGSGPSAAPGAAPPNPSAIAVYPLAIPKIAGPAAMLTVVLLTDDDRFDLPHQAMTVGVLVLVLAITFGILLAAGPISRVIGESGASVIGRVMGMLLLALAVHTVLSAFGAWLNLPSL
jgi:multiple antibiotic resistance protein